MFAEIESRRLRFIAAPARFTIPPNDFADRRELGVFSLCAFGAVLLSGKKRLFARDVPRAKFRNSPRHENLGDSVTEIPFCTDRIERTVVGERSGSYKSRLPDFGEPEIPKRYLTLKSVVFLYTTMFKKSVFKIIYNLTIINFNS